MRNFLFAILFFLSFSAFYAQTQKPVVYLSLSSISKGSKQSIDYIQGHHLFEIAYFVYGYEDKNLPSDYVPGSSFLGTKNKPHVFIQSGSLSYGYSYKLDKIVRLNPKIGISYNFIENPENYQPNSDDGGFFGNNSNYKHDNLKTRQIGIQFNPEVQFLISRVNALSFGLDLNVMKEHTLLLFELSLEFGRMRDKKIKK